MQKSTVRAQEVCRHIDFFCVFMHYLTLRLFGLAILSIS